MTTSSPGPAISSRRAVGALAALGIAAFSYVTTEVLPIGLLTVMAADLGRSPSEVGRLVTGYAIVVVAASLPLTRLTYRMPRRLLLGGTLGIFAAATLLSALASTYAVLLTARLLIALTQALFWSVAAPTVTRLFPAAVRGRVVARMAIGTALAPILGIPAGTWLGQQAGWRTTFLVMAGIGAATCAAVTALLSSRLPADGGSTRGSTPDPRRYAVLVTATAIGVTGFLTANTYITPFLLDVSGFAPATLGPLLFVAGAGGLAGTLTIGVVLDRRPGTTLIAPLGLLAFALLGLYALGPVRAFVIAMLAGTGVAFSALAVVVQNRTLQVAPGSIDIASAGTSSAFNVGIATGALLGGALIDGPGVRSVPLVGGLLVAAALAIVLAEPWLVGPVSRGHRATAGQPIAGDPLPAHAPAP